MSNELVGTHAHICAHLLKTLPYHLLLRSLRRQGLILSAKASHRERFREYEMQKMGLYSVCCNLYCKKTKIHDRSCFTSYLQRTACSHNVFLLGFLFWMLLDVRIFHQQALEHNNNSRGQCYNKTYSTLNASIELPQKFMLYCQQTKRP